jgi:hypothetical protein
VMLPFTDPAGVLGGYMGRATEGEPKYLIPSGFPKSQFLFGADVIKAGKFGQLPLRFVYGVESPLCALRYACHGLPAVAFYGWSVSQEQLRILCTLCKGLLFLPDKNKRTECTSVVQLLAQSLWVRMPDYPTEDPERLTRPQILAL